MAPSTASKDGRGRLAVLAEEKPQEHRDAQEPHQRDEVGCGQDPVEPGVGTFLFDHGPSLRVDPPDGTGPPARGVCQSGAMPRFEPFHGLRYATDQAPVAQVIAPPYDVITPTERVHLASRHQANSVLVELPEADLRGGRDRYQVAADLFSGWLASGILSGRGRAEPLSVPHDGRRRAQHHRRHRRAGSGRARARRVTCSPTSRRCPSRRATVSTCLRATRANLSPIWGLSMAAGVTATFDPTDDEPVADAYDDDEVRHQLWVLSDPDAVAAVADAVAAAPVVLADGHHRYETARAYQAECRDANGGKPGPYDLVMALVVELAEEQLSVGRDPSHGARPARGLRPRGRPLRMVRRRPGRGGRRAHTRRPRRTHGRWPW